MSTVVQNAEVPNPNHPKLGDTIKVEPIRTVNAINKLKQLLAPSPRNYALFVVGINTAYRASQLLSTTLGQVRHLQPGDRLDVKQEKTKKYRAVTMNVSCHEAIQKLLEHLDHILDLHVIELVFASQLLAQLGSGASPVELQE